MNKEAKDIQLFGKVVSRHGQPLAGVGIALLETFSNENPDRKKSKPDEKANEEPASKQRVVATAVSDSNGLFIINASIPENITGTPYSLQASASKNAVELSELKGQLTELIPGRLYGPLTIVVDQDKPAPKNAVTHRPVLIASEEEILAAIKRAPGLFFRAQAARSPDPCSPYSPLGVPSRIVRYSGTVRFPSPTKEQLDSEGDTSVDGLGRLFPITHDAPRTSISELIRWGFLSEIEQAWFDLGLGLGNLLYSVPLAPCEETKFAIVDWRRKDWARRESAVDERHFQRTSVKRDQTVDETVSMTSNKNANANTSTTGVGLALGPLTIGVGTTGSGGHEDIKSDVHADRWVNDETKMASQTVRNTRAFAIVEATQEEESVVRTRVLRNHNHCHTITFQYFEV